MENHLIAELDTFLAEYCRRTNTHDVSNLRELIANDATYWFTDGSFEGIDAITAAIQQTFDTIQDELYTMTDIQWICTTLEWAVVRYHFHWTGTINGQHHKGQGRGTNAMTKHTGSWQMTHEHLSH